MNYQSIPNSGVTHKILTSVLCAMALTIFYSCERDHHNPMVTTENYQKITAGMPREEVIQILGEPDSILKSRPCKCADIETMSYLSGKIGIDVKIFNKKVCEKNYVDFAKYEIRE